MGPLGELSQQSIAGYPLFVYRGRVMPHNVEAPSTGGRLPTSPPGPAPTRTLAQIEPRTLPLTPASS